MVATSGDTGSAIADAFYEVEGIDVMIFYPKDKISQFQELQMITYGKNIMAIGINGTFDDCQKYVKMMLKNNELNGMVISANSINIIRLLPQTLYYFYFYSLLKHKYGKKVENNVIFSIPCGNCGNLTGAILAKKLGLPIKYIIAAQNINDTFYRYIKTGKYEKKPSQLTIANAMDVGNPNNFARINYIYKDACMEEIQDEIKTERIVESEINDTIKQIWFQYNYLIDPHTGVAIAAVDKILKNTDDDSHNSYTVIISTARPEKFVKTIQKIIPHAVITNDYFNKIKVKHKEKFFIKNNYDKILKVVTQKVKRVNKVILIGMPGCGKTTIAKKLHKMYNNKYLDIDEEIESIYGQQLIDMVSQYNMDDIEYIEKECMLNVDISKYQIISTGGSAIYYNEAMKYLSKNALVIFLDVGLKEIMKRTKNLTNRGVIYKSGMNAENLFRERYKLYLKYSDITIYENNLNILINQIHNFLK